MDAIDLRGTVSCRQSNYWSEMSWLIMTILRYRPFPDLAQAIATHQPKEFDHMLVWKHLFWCPKSTKTIVYCNGLRHHSHVESCTEVANKLVLWPPRAHTSNLDFQLAQLSQWERRRWNGKVERSAESVLFNTGFTTSANWGGGQQLLCSGKPVCGESIRWNHHESKRAD